MKVIYKYPLYAPENVIELPKGAKVLHVHEQKGEAMIWIIGDVNPMQTEERTFILVGTGNHFNVYDGEYIGTVHLEVFVWHVYEVPR